MDFTRFGSGSEPVIGIPFLPQLEAMALEGDAEGPALIHPGVNVLRTPKKPDLVLRLIGIVFDDLLSSVDLVMVQDLRCVGPGSGSPSFLMHRDPARADRLYTNRHKLTKLTSYPVVVSPNVLCLEIDYQGRHDPHSVYAYAVCEVLRHNLKEAR